VGKVGGSPEAVNPVEANPAGRPRAGVNPVEAKQPAEGKILAAAKVLAGNRLQVADRLPEADKAAAASRAAVNRVVAKAVAGNPEDKPRAEARRVVDRQPVVEARVEVKPVAARPAVGTSLARKRTSQACLTKPVAAAVVERRVLAAAGGRSIPAAVTVAAAMIVAVRAALGAMRQARVSSWAAPR
jgi:hypothetical protein